MIARGFSLCLLAFGASATLAVDGDLPTSGVGEIVNGTRSCIGATTQTALDQRKLRSDGWKLGSITSPDGKLAANAPTIYFRGGLLMMIPAGQVAVPLCMFSARISSVEDFSKVQAAMIGAYGPAAKDEGKGDLMFLTADQHIIDLALTGKMERPAVRVAVGFVPQEKK